MKKKQKQKKTIKKKQKSFETKNEKNTGYPAHESPQINISHIFAEVRGLDILHFCLFYVCSRSVLFYVLLFSVLFMCSPSLCKLLHLQSKKHMSNHVLKKEKEKKNNKKRMKMNFEKKEQHLKKEEKKKSQLEPEKYL